MTISITNKNGTVDHLLLSQVRYLQQQLAALTEKSMRDGLTNLYNRVYLQQWMTEHREDSKQVIVAYIDVDWLKPVNDRYGHRAGDEVLCHVANLLKNCCRKNDCAIRLSGDEFLLIRTDIAQKKLSIMMKRIEQKLQKVSQVGFSFGLVSGGASQLNELIDAADKEMYRHKTSKRTLEYADLG